MACRSGVRHRSNVTCLLKAVYSSPAMQLPIHHAVFFSGWSKKLVMAQTRQAAPKNQKINGPLSQKLKMEKAAQKISVAVPQVTPIVKELARRCRSGISC